MVLKRQISGKWDLNINITANTHIRDGDGALTVASCKNLAQVASPQQTNQPSNKHSSQAFFAHVGKAPKLIVMKVCTSV